MIWWEEKESRKKLNLCKNKRRNHQKKNSVSRKMGLLQGIFCLIGLLLISSSGMLHIDWHLKWNCCWLVDMYLNSKWIESEITAAVEFVDLRAYTCYERLKRETCFIGFLMFSLYPFVVEELSSLRFPSSLKEGTSC